LPVESGFYSQAMDRLKDDETRSGWHNNDDLEALIWINELYDEAWPIQKKNDFSYIFALVRRKGFLLSKGYTHPGRLAEEDRIVQALVSLARKNNEQPAGLNTDHPLVILDVAASTMITTLELAVFLEDEPGLCVVGTDRHLELLYSRKGDNIVFSTQTDVIVQIKIEGRIYVDENDLPADYSIRTAFRRVSEEERMSLSLVDPQALSYAAAYPQRFSIDKLDIFFIDDYVDQHCPLVKPGIIRVMNLSQWVQSLETFPKLFSLTSDSPEGYYLMIGESPGSGDGKIGVYQVTSSGHQLLCDGSAQTVLERIQKLAESGSNPGHLDNGGSHEVATVGMNKTRILAVAAIPLIAILLSVLFGNWYVAAVESSIIGGIVLKSIIGGIGRGCGMYTNQTLNSEPLNQENIGKIARWMLWGGLYLGIVVFGGWYWFLTEYVKSDLLKVLFDVSVFAAFVGLPANFGATYSTQWFERTLDDSAIRRMDMPQAFLLTDAILKLFLNITDGMVVYPKQIERHLMQEIPFMATEKILMACVEKGESRQEMHEIVKNHSVAAGKVVKEEGRDNDLLDRLGDDPAVPFSRDEIMELIKGSDLFTGRAKAQTEEYLSEVVEPLLGNYKNMIDNASQDINV